MSENVIGQLGVIANRILETQKKFMHEVMDALNNLKVLPRMVTDIREDMNQGFSRVIQSEAEMEIYLRMAQMSSKKSLLNAENEAIEEFRAQLKYDFDEIDKRYSKIQNELNEESRKRIREIDQHLFEIPDKFPEDLYLNFMGEIMPLIKRLQNDSRISYEERLKAVTLAVNKSRDTISSFIAIRNDFMKDVRDYQFQSDGAEEETWFVPVWLVESENAKENKVFTSAFLPGESVNNTETLEPDSNKMVPDNNLGPYLRILKDPSLQKHLIDTFEWKPNEKESDELLANFEKYFDSRYQGKYSGIKKAVIKSFSEFKVKFINQN